MTMQIKITNEDTNPSRAAKVTEVSYADDPKREIPGHAVVLKAGESQSFWIYKGRDVRVEEVDVP